MVDASVIEASIAVVSSATELGGAKSSPTVVFEGKRLENAVVAVGAEVASAKSAEDTTDASRVADVWEIKGTSSLVVVSRGAASSTAYKKSDTVLSLRSIEFNVPTKQDQEEVPTILMFRQVLPPPKSAPRSRLHSQTRLPQLLLVRLPVVCHLQVLGEVPMCWPLRYRR